MGKIALTALLIISMLRYFEKGTRETSDNYIEMQAV